MSFSIEQNVKNILASLPPHVQLVAAAKTRSAEEVEEAMRGGITQLGYNYVQEAGTIQKVIGHKGTWHLIGHLQRNKAKKAVELFDMIQTIDSVKLAEAVNRHCEASGKVMPILLEVNSGEESNKTGVFPENVAALAEEICHFNNLKIQGLMTMAPWLPNAEETRPFFRATKAVFDRIAQKNLPNVEMRFLSMGMSHSYQVAIEEGANIVRIGTRLFGEREKSA